jgi:hypothetical protein
MTGQRLEPDRSVLSCRVVESDPGDRWCRRCGCQGTDRDSVVRQLAPEPFGWRPTTLAVTVRRNRCGDCARVWRQDTTGAAEPNAKLSRAAARWALEALVVQHLTVAKRIGTVQRPYAGAPCSGAREGRWTTRDSSPTCSTRCRLVACSGYERSWPATGSDCGRRWKAPGGRTAMRR